MCGAAPRAGGGGGTNVLAPRPATPSSGRGIQLRLLTNNCVLVLSRAVDFPTIAVPHLPGLEGGSCRCPPSHTLLACVWLHAALIFRVLHIPHHARTPPPPPPPLPSTSRGQNPTRVPSDGDLTVALRNVVCCAVGRSVGQRSHVRVNVRRVVLCNRRKDGCWCTNERVLWWREAAATAQKIKRSKDQRSKEI